MKFDNIHRKVPVLALAGLPLQNTYGDCFWIFAAANTFNQLNLVFFADSRSGFCPELLKTRVKAQKLPIELFCKKGALEILQVLQENNCVKVSF